MATIATTTSPAGNVERYCVYSDYDTAGSWGQYHMTTTRDNTLVFVDTQGFLNFTSDSRTSINRVATLVPTSNSNTWYGVLRDVTDNIIFVACGNNTSNYLRVVKYNKPSEGWKAWADNPSRGSLSVAYDTAPVRIYSADSGNNGHYKNALGLHIARTANISSGTLVVTWSATGRGDGTYPYYIGYSVNLNTGGIISRGALQTADIYYPILSATSATGPYGFGPAYMGWMGQISQQDRPYSSTIWVGSYFTNGNYGSYHNQADMASRTAGYYGLVWAKVLVDANGNITAPDYYYTDTDRQGSKRTWDAPSTGQFGMSTSKSTYSPANYPSTNWVGNSILICTIFNNKPLITDERGYFKWQWSTQPTGFVFNTQYAPNIHWINDTNILRMYGSNGTSLTYIDITWDGTNFTFPASATVVESTGANIDHRINPLPVYTMQDAFYNTTLSKAINTGSSTSYAYTGVNGAINEPYVSTLKANNGMKFVLNTSAFNTDYQTAYFPAGTNYNPMKVTDTFQFRRVSSGGTEYYNYTTNTWTSAVVNNASGLFPGGGGYIPSFSTVAAYTHDLAGTWADNTSYTYSIVYTDSASATISSSVRTIATPAVSAAPTSPTPRRLFVFPLNGRTSAHILSIENRVLINKIHIVNTSGSTTTVSLNLGGYNILSSQSVTANQTLQINTAIIANVAERLLATCSADNAITLWVMGTEGV